LHSGDHGDCRGDGISLFSFLRLSRGVRYCCSFVANGFHLELGLIQTAQGRFQRGRTGLAFCDISDGLVLVLLAGYKHGLTQLQLLFYCLFFA